MLKEHPDDTPQHFEIIEAVGISTRVVGQEEPQEDDDEVLECKGKPVNVAPGGIFSDNPGEEASNKEAQEEAGHYDREGSCAPMRWGEFANEGEHCQISV